MACYHPLKGFLVGINEETGKKKLKITPYNVDYLYSSYGKFHYGYFNGNGDIVDSIVRSGNIITDVGFVGPHNNYGTNVSNYYFDFVPIPCGQCVGCRLEHSRQWAVRCMLESEYHDDNYFITLTYSDDTVPISEYIDIETGEIKTSLTLNKKDVQNFIKRLRRHFAYRGSRGFRYFCCGEYGSKTARPHYHMIAFGLYLDDLVLWKETPLGNYYTSELLTSKWGHGHVIIGSVTFESCAYVSRYIMKKQKGKGADVYSKYNISPEYIVMSRNPGIANKYFKDHIDDIYPADTIVLRGGKLSTPPRYFDNLMNDLDEELMSDIKQKRADIAMSIQQYKDTLTTADYQKQLEYAENNKMSQVCKLVRPL